MLRCPYCGCDTVIQDPLTGTLVCSNCGVVIDEAPVDVTGGTRRRKIGESVEVFLRKEPRVKPDSVQIDFEKEIDMRKLRLTRKFRAVLSKNVILKAADETGLARLLEVYNLHIVEQLLNLVKTLESQGVLKKRSIRMKLAIANVLYDYVRGKYPNFSEYARLYGVSVLSLKRFFKEIVQNAKVVEVVQKSLSGFVR